MLRRRNDDVEERLSGPHGRYLPFFAMAEDRRLRGLDNGRWRRAANDAGHKGLLRVLGKAFEYAA